MTSELHNVPPVQVWHLVGDENKIKAMLSCPDDARNRAPFLQTYASC